MTVRSGRYDYCDWSKATRSTPDSVGPGAYGESTTQSLSETKTAVALASKKRAPFGVSQGRGNLHAEAECPRGPPVGFYESWAPPMTGTGKICSQSVFRSKSQRSDPGAKVEPWGGRSKRSYTPGPGAYNTPRVMGPCPGPPSPSAKTARVLKGDKQTQKLAPGVGANARSECLSRTGCTPRPTVPSIPGRGDHGYEAKEDGRLVPRKPRRRPESFESDAESQAHTHPRTRGGLISPLKPEIDRSVSETPGPATYDPTRVEMMRIQRPTSAFASFSPRQGSSLGSRSETPGPGHYNEILRRRSPEQMEPFGSSSDRLGNVVGGSPSPGPGYVGHQDLLLAQQRTRKGSLIPGFGTAERGWSRHARKGSSPGPGSYHAKGVAYDTSGRALASVFEATSKGSNFGKGSTRDAVQRSQTPGPGTYEGNSKSARVRSLSPSAAFQVIPRQSPVLADTPAATDYDPHSPRASSSRSPTRAEGFLAVSKRFTALSPSPYPGPGSYDVPVLSVGASAPFGARTESAAGQASSPGPGSYDPPDQWHGKNFNVLYGEVE